MKLPTERITVPSLFLEWLISLEPFVKGFWSTFLGWTFQTPLYTLVWACRLLSSVQIKGFQQGWKAVIEVAIDKHWHIFFFPQPFLCWFGCIFGVTVSCWKTDLWPCPNFQAEGTKLKCPGTSWYQQPSALKVHFAYFLEASWYLLHIKMTCSV